MSANPAAVPRLDDRGREALARLRGTPEFKLYESHLKALLQYHQHVLMTLSVDEVPRFQGRGQMLSELLQMK